MKSLGAFGEAWAVGHLSRLGYRIVDRNVRFREGELDIVATHADCLVFVEVKTRKNRAYGLPEESITARRYDHLRAAAQRYVQTRGLESSDYRIDLLSLEVDASGRVAHHRLLENVAPPIL